MTQRESWMMPTPFVLNDAVVIRQKIKPSAIVAETVLKKPIVNRTIKDSLAIIKDSLSAN